MTPDSDGRYSSPAYPSGAADDMVGLGSRRGGATSPRRNGSLVSLPSLGAADARPNRSGTLFQEMDTFAVEGE